MTAMRNALTAEQLAEQAEWGEPEKGPWSQAEQLLASAVDELRRVSYILIAANSDGKAKRPDPPEPIRRPGAKPRRTKERLTETGAERLFRLINGGSQEAG